MSLRDLNYKSTYSTLQVENDINENLIKPALKEAVEYRRAVGYFNSKSLSAISEGIDGILANNGKIKIIASPELSDIDIEKIKLGYSLREEEIENILLKSIDKEFELEKKSPLNFNLEMDLIVNLIAEGFLDIKIVFYDNGLYHEKLGQIIDDEGNSICFNGSLNETYSAYESNIETVNVFPNWIDILSNFHKDIETNFINLWDDNIQKLNVIEFPEAIEKRLFELYKKSNSVNEAVKLLKKKQDNNKNEKKIRKYQQEAINEFMIDNSHFYEMATGTGKTFTALQTIKKINAQNQKTFTVIIVPSIDLQSQWHQECVNLSFENINLAGGGNSKDWESNLSNNIIKYNNLNQNIIYIITYDTFFDKIADRVSKLKDLFIIVDEAHELTDNNMKKMPKNPKYRLGLSATPERHNSEEIERILKYFLNSKKTTYKFDIEQAIKMDFLTNYKYFPILIDLTEDEFERYKSYSRRILIESNQKAPDFETINRWKNERSLIVKKAQNKLLVMEELITVNRNDFNNSVVYCGAGKAEDEELIIDKVTKMLYRQGSYKVSTFTSKTFNRSGVLKKFEEGFFDVLVAIKCFDQGVDVPKLDKIHLLSSDSLLRQATQRRGRVLRKCKEANKKIAKIYDYIAIPPKDINLEAGITLIRNEFRRVKEYNRLAINSIDNEYMLKPYLDLIHEEEGIDNE